jgi:hypothetical protein
VAAVAGVTAFASLPGGVVVELLVGALDRVREGGKKGAAAAEDLEREISEAIQRALSTGNRASTELRAEIADVLKKIDAGGEVLRAALDESDERVRQDIIAAVGFLGAHFERAGPEVGWRVRTAACAVAGGYADLDPGGRPGLSARAHAEFGIPVIGVAKSRFRTATHAVPVVRGSSGRPARPQPP